MKKVLLGFFIGVLTVVFFFAFGGARYVKLLGAKTEEAGVRLEGYEKSFKAYAKEAKRSADKTIDDTVDRTKEKVDKAREYVK